MPNPQDVLDTFEEDQSNAGKVLAAAPPRPTMTHEDRVEALRKQRAEQDGPPTGPLPPLFSTRGVTISHEGTGPVTLGELRQFVAAAEGLDDGLPIKIQSWTEDEATHALVEVMDQENLGG